MSFDLILGYVLIGFGIYVAIARIVAPQQFGKLQAMKNKWGAKRGLALHVFAYTVLPLITGALMVFNEIS